MEVSELVSLFTNASVMAMCSFISFTEISITIFTSYRVQGKYQNHKEAGLTKLMMSNFSKKVAMMFVTRCQQSSENEIEC